MLSQWQLLPWEWGFQLCGDRTVKLARSPDAKFIAWTWILFKYSYIEDLITNTAMFRGGLRDVTGEFWPHRWINPLMSSLAKLNKLLENVALLEDVGFRGRAELWRVFLVPILFHIGSYPALCFLDVMSYHFTLPGPPTTRPLPWNQLTVKRGNCEPNMYFPLCIYLCQAFSHNNEKQPLRLASLNSEWPWPKEPRFLHLVNGNTNAPVPCFHWEKLRHVFWG